MISKQVIFFIADFDRASAVLDDHPNHQLPWCSSATRLDIEAWSPEGSYLRYQDLIPGCDARLHPLSFSIEATGSYCQHLRLIQLFDATLGQEDARGCLRVGFDALDENAV